MVVMDRFKGDLKDEKGNLIIKKGKWLPDEIPKMYVHEGRTLYVIDSESKHVLELMSLGCGVGQSYGFRLEYFNKKDPHSDDIGTFFYNPVKKVWVFTQW